MPNRECLIPHNVYIALLAGHERQEDLAHGGGFEYHKFSIKGRLDHTVEQRSFCGAGDALVTPLAAGPVAQTDLSGAAIYGGQRRQH